MYESSNEKFKLKHSNIILSDVLKKYSHVRMATSKDNDLILKFFSSIHMETPGLNLYYDRAPNFFNLVLQQGDFYQIALFLNDDGSIGGMATFCVGTHIINGKVDRAAYLSDLRISPKISRTGRIQWRKFYTEVVQMASKSPDFDFCKFQYSAVLDENIPAIQALTKGKFELVYKPLFKYKTFTIYGEKPFRKKAQGAYSLSVTRANQEDSEAIKDFLWEQNKNSSLGYAFPEELERRFKLWPDFTTENFLLAKDKLGKIRALCAPYSQNKTRKMVIDKISWKTRALSFCSPLMGRPNLVQGNPLNMLYLTHLYFGEGLSTDIQNEILRRFIDTTNSMFPKKNYHGLSFFEMEGQDFEADLKESGYLFQNTPATLYQVYHPDSHHVIDSIKKPNFEIGLA